MACLGIRSHVYTEKYNFPCILTGHKIKICSGLQKIAPPFNHQYQCNGVYWLSSAMVLFVS